MNDVAIIGLGLMGGSLGLALKSKGHRGRITGFTRNPASRETALQRGAVDAVFDHPGDAVGGADITVFCAPILAIPGLVRETLPSQKRGSVLTDVGSTKAYLVRELSALAAQAETVFIGGHPIAGSEQQGIEVAKPNLYEGATIVITPGKESPGAAVKKVEALWRSVGGVVYMMDPEEHDCTVALTSHLPHLTAALLAATVGRGGKEKSLAAFCGSGFRDTSRVAEGPPGIWDDILRTNHAHVLEELKAFGNEVNGLIAHLERKDFPAVARLLEKGRASRRVLVGK